MSEHHTVPCRPSNCHWGFFDAALPPLLTVASGDTVTVECVSGGRDILPTDSDAVTLLRLIINAPAANNVDIFTETVTDNPFAAKWINMAQAGAAAGKAA